MVSVWRSKLGGEFPRELIDRLDAEHLSALRKLRAEPHNARCADCGRMNNTWASVNLGVFLCDRCADVHRALGTHISKVKSCTGSELWGPDEMIRMEELDLVLPNKQIRCASVGEAEPSKTELMDHCLKKYGIKTVLCKKEVVCDNHRIVISSSKSVGSASQSTWNDFSAEQREPSANGCGISSPALSPTASQQSPKRDHSIASSNHNQPLSKDLSEFNFDEFFSHMHATSAAGDVAACANERGKVTVTCSTSAVAGLEDADDKQLSNCSSLEVNDLFEAHVCAVPDSAIAPSPSPLERISTDEVWEDFEW